MKVNACFLEEIANLKKYTNNFYQYFPQDQLHPILTNHNLVQNKRR